MNRALLLVLLVLLSSCERRAPAPSPPPTTPRAEVGWLKGQTHAHSSGSGDSQTPPADVARWYAERGYDFVVLTDHNVITRHEADDILVLPGVELTQNMETCDPPPPSPDYACLLHVNSLFVDGDDVPWGPEPGIGRLDRYVLALDASAKMGGVAQLNHPNMHFAASASLVADLAKRGLLLMEIANMSDDSMNEGLPPDHPDVETLWDQVLASGVTVYGVATDDSHHYDDAAALRARGEQVFTGDRGWVMVHAERDAASIEAALRRGDFYATTGPILERLEVTATELVVEGPAGSTVTVIANGQEILRSAGEVRYPRDRIKGYVRVEVADATGTAWTQPVR